VALKAIDCELPEKGWGRLILAESMPVATKKFTDSGERHDKRGLKQRDPNAVRIVPIPPRLLAYLRGAYR
jgi:hypothetical protein